MLLSILDAVAFSSIWVAAAAGALCASASLAMGVTPTFSVAGIAVSGTLFVYNVDRLRDLDRDRATTPERSAFVERNRGILVALTAAAGLVSLAFAFSVGPGPTLLLLPVLAAGLAHRRLKRMPFAKSAYITAAWLLVVVGVAAALGMLLGAAAPPAVRPLIAVSLATLAALVAFRAGERYGLIVVDGALLAGALLAAGWRIA
jgi:hypothetical protein